MSQRTDLLEHERRKLALLRTKLADQERRVKMLEDIEDDPLDALLDRELASVHAPSVGVQAPALAVSGPATPPPAAPFVLAPPATTVQWGHQPRYPRKVPTAWVQLLRFIGLEGKSNDEVKTYIRDRQLHLSEGAARTQLMIYRKEFGFVENPKKGFYKATQRALTFIEAQEAGNPARQGEVSETQPDPLARAAA